MFKTIKNFYKKNKVLSISLFAIMVVFGIANSTNITSTVSPEFAIHSISPYNKFAGKTVAASCGFRVHGSADEFTACTTQVSCNGVTETRTGRSLCGGVCQATIGCCPAGQIPNAAGTACVAGCTNGATNYPTCNQCPTGSSMISGQCTCTNGATNVAGGCNICPSGTNMINGVCGCANGATNPTQCNICPSGTNMLNGQCTCSNGASAISGCTACPVGQSLVNGVCGIPCSVSNACGQSVQGRKENGICNTDNGSTNQYGYENINSSCIQTFNITSSSVYPNGSTEFAWTFPTLPAGVGRRCGFVDLSNPNNPTPIPGLQNLDSTVDRVRIQNIQRTTNFCLVCSYYDIATNQSRGDAAAHQWVRVIRVGEN